VITNQIYPIALLLSTGKRTCESMGKQAELSGDTMLRMLDEHVTIEEKCAVVNQFFNNKRLDAIVDDVLLEKRHAKSIDGISFQRNTSTHTSCRSLCTVVIMVGDGEYYVPVTHQFWIKKEKTDPDYRTKHAIAKELLRSIIQHCKIRIVLADALYATVEFMKELNQLNLRFEMKIHANRIVILQSGEAIAIREAFNGKLKGRRWRTIPIAWKGLTLFLTACKRYNKHGECKIIYQISNYRATASAHFHAYKRRWHIEKFFRTGKQSLGLKDCQSRSLTRHTHHIDNVFIAYIILQMERRKYKLETPEAALRLIKKRNPDYLNSYLSAPNQILETANA
jgi:SRSO17 transposase